MNKLGTNVELDAKIRETNSMEAINAVVECEYNMGIIRYPVAEAYGSRRTFYSHQE